MNLFTLFAKLVLDTDEYEEKIKKSTESANTFASTFKAIIASDIFKKASDVMVQFATSSISAASSLDEVQNVVDVTFGTDSGKINRWAQSANRSFGLTELQAKKFTSTLGAMMKSSGLTGDAVTEMSIDLAGLAADMASFYNLDYDLAFEKIRSGISGETEPLKQLGINMSVANLEAYAMTQGITKSFDKMSQGEQVQLRYNYLMQATADAQGDFARTSDSLANSSRALEGNIESLKAKIGEALVPALESATGAANELLTALTPETSLSQTIENIESDYEGQLKEITDTESSVNILVRMLEDLGDQSGLTADEQERWTAICSKLVETLPGLNSIINTQTGEIKGGTAAIMEYTQAWADNAKQQALTTAMTEANTALATARGQAASAEVALEMAEEKRNALLEDREELLKKISDESGKSLEALKADLGELGQFGGGIGWFLSDDEKAYNVLTDSITSASTEIANLTRENEKAQTNFEEGLITYERTAQAFERLNEQYSVNAGLSQEDAEQTAKLTQLYSDFEEAYSSLETQMKEAETYRASMLESTRADIEKTVNGFSRIGLEDMAASFGEDIHSMTLGLQDQVSFMEEYASNLQEAAEKGVDEGLLATLSDGSKESALYLQQIVTGTEGDIASLNAAWTGVQEGKETFAQALADQKLEADTQYDAIIAKTDEMVSNLDQKTTAYTNAANTASGIAEGLLSQQDAIDLAVATINGKLSALGAWTIGNVPRISTQDDFSTSHNAHGLDYVPTNDYPAWLHKGEAVLTSNEAEAWRAIQSEPRGNASLDLDGLARVIVSAMSSVKLQMDRRTVGQVVAPVVSEEIAREARMRRNDL